MDPQELQQIEQYLRRAGLNADELRNRMDAIRNSTAQFNLELANANRELSEMSSEFTDLSKQFKNVLDDLRGWDSTSGRINKSFKTLGGLADKLKYDAEDISRLNKKDLESLDKKARIELSNLKARKAELDLNLKNKNLDDLRLQAIADALNSQIESKETELTESKVKSMIEDLIAISGKTLEIVWDTTKPNGDMRRQMDTTKQKQLYLLPKTSFKDALKITYEYYINNLQK